MQRKFCVSFHVPGELSADLDIRFIAPSPCKLVHVSAVQSDADPAGIEVGRVADLDAYIKKFSCGVSGTPVEKEALSDFDGDLANSQFPRVADGDIVTVAVDYDYNDGGGSGAASDVTIVLTFVEG